MKWLFLFLLWPNLAWAQPAATYRDYIPYQAEYTPEVHVRVVLHVLQDSAGTQNLHPDSAAHRAFIQQVWHDACRTFTHNQPARLPTGSLHLPDTRIRLVAHPAGPIWHRDSLGLWDFRGKERAHSLQNTRGRQLYQHYVLNDSTIPWPDSAFHVFLANGSSIGGKGIAAGIGNGRWAIVLKTDANYRAGRYWHSSHALAHELGHLMGLKHVCPRGDGLPDTYPPKSYRDTALADPCVYNGPGSNNNLMGYNAHQNHLSAHQIGRMHYFLGGEAGNIHPVVVPRWLTHDPRDSITLEPGDTLVIRGVKRHAAGIYVKSGAHLHVDGTLMLPVYRIKHQAYGTVHINGPIQYSNFPHHAVVLELDVIQADIPTWRRLRREWTLKWAHQVTREARTVGPDAPAVYHELYGR